MATDPTRQDLEEELSREVDAAATKVGDAVEQAGHAAGQKMEQAGQKIEQAGQNAGEAVDNATRELRERKKEAKQAVNNAATVVADKAERAADVAAVKVEKAADKTAAAAQQVAHDTGNIVKDIQTRVLTTISTVQQKAIQYSKDPAQLGHSIRTQLDSRIHDRLLVIFLVMWAPIWIMVAGSGVGQIVNLFFHNFSYFLGLAAAGYCWSLLTSSSPTPNYQQKTLTVFLVASIVPIIVLDIGSTLLKIVGMLAFAGAPFIFTLLYNAPSSPGVSIEKDLNKLTAEERFLQFATATSVIFGMSVLPGDNSFLHRVFVAVLFGGAAYGAHYLIPIVLSKVPPAQKPVIDPHQVVVFALLEILLGHILLFILGFVLPQSVLDAEHSAFAVLGLTLIGLVFLAGANALSTGFLVGKVPPQTLDMIRKFGAMGIVGSYVILMLAYIMHFNFFGFASTDVTVVTVHEAS